VEAADNVAFQDGAEQLLRAPESAEDDPTDARMTR